MRALAGCAVFASAVFASAGLAGCTVLGTSNPVVEALPVRVAALWDPTAVGQTVVVGPVVVTSPRTVDGGSFWVADPEGGRRSGLRIDLGPGIEAPPSTGVEWALTGTVVATDPPALALADDADADVFDAGSLDQGSLDEAPDPVVAPYADDPELAGALVHAGPLTVTSPPDPLGRADTSLGVAIGGRFGVSPGWNRTGELTGILDGDAISARSPDDWTGDLDGDPPLDVGLDALGTLADGASVTIGDLVLATPWSRDLREAVVQDPT
ncbi:MAG: hypothetical protein ABMB14_19585, partial [Myxococcota bacterium]